MSCGCHTRQDGQITSKLGTYDFSSDPVNAGSTHADWYAHVEEHEIASWAPADAGYDIEGPLPPRLPGSSPIGPGYAYTPHPPATALSHERVYYGPRDPDPESGWCTPVTSPQHNYGYHTIYSVQVEALEGPRYSYAGMDTELILEEAQARAQGVFLR
jgi:hypothetical protein